MLPPGTPDLVALERLAAVDPKQVVEVCTTYLLGEADDAVTAGLLRVRGIGLRRQRRVADARADLERSVDAARASGDQSLVVRCLLTLAGVMDYLGEATKALAVLATVPDVADDRLMCDVAVQQAFLLQRSGAIADAERAYRRALDLLGTAGGADRADLLANRGIMRTYEGRLSEAGADFAEALTLYRELGHEHVVTEMLHNQAWLDARRGDLVQSLAGFAHVAERYAAEGLSEDAHYPDDCEPLLAAGLATEARDRAMRSATALLRNEDRADAAEVLLLGARAAIAAGDLPRAAKAADGARQLFREAQRPGWEAEAHLLCREVEVRTGGAGAGEVASLEDLARVLESSGLHVPAVDAIVLAARAACDGDRLTDAARLLDRAARRRPLAHQRLALLALRAAVANRAGAPATARRALREGETLLDDLRMAVGSPELRSHLALYGAELSTADVDRALASRSAAQLLRATERWRAASLRLPRVRRPSDPQLGSALDALRTAEHKAQAAIRDGTHDASHERALRQLRRRVAEHTRASAGSPVQVDKAPALGALREQLDGWTAVVLAEHRGTLYGLLPTSRRASIVALASCELVQREAALLRSSLGRVLTSARPDTRVNAEELVVEAARRVDDLLLGPLELPDDTQVVVVPPSSLGAVPWSCLPRLIDRVTVVAPSLTLWTMWRRSRPDGDSRVALVAGPDLQLADEEVLAISRVHAGAHTVASSSCTPESLLGALDGASIAHLACHGTIAPENPLFSTLLTSQGPVYVHDLERLSRPPALAILSACHVGAASSRPGNELLGFTTTLLGLGTRTVIAALQAVPDHRATIELMTTLHRRLRQGASPARALSDARQSLAQPDRSIGWAFSCFGAG